MRTPLALSKRTPKKSLKSLSPQPRLTVGQYLLLRLETAGITHIFSPQNENASYFLKLLTLQKKLTLITTQAPCDLASGFARVKNKAAFSVLKNDVKTCLSSMYYASYENIPLLSIILSHDTVKSEASDLKKTDLFFDFTMKGTSEELEEATEKLIKKCFLLTQVIDDPSTAAKKIDRAIDCALYYQKPVAIELLESLVDTPIPAHTPEETRFPASDPEALRDAVLHIRSLLKKAVKPFIAIGREAVICSAHTLIMQFAQKLALPVCALDIARGIVDETHPLFFGSYSETLPSALKGSDTILFFGAAKDTRSKFAHTISIFEQSVSVDGVKYPHISLFDITTQLAFVHFPEKEKMAFPKPKHYPFEAVKNQKITARRAVECVLKHSEECIIVSNHPKLLSIISDIPLRQGALITSKKQGDFSLPAAIGASFTSPEQRLVVIVGEINLELSFSSLFTIAKHNLAPVVIVLSEKKHSLSLHYKAIPDLLGKGKVFHVISEESFEHALERSLRSQNELTIIDTVCEKHH
jgi:indolepyruvate decarboxylase